jgi:gamma-glutamyl hercynylcysteine S-oxide synthase
MPDRPESRGPVSGPLSAETVAQDLERARSRTGWLTDLDESELRSVHSPIMSPLVWDLAHVAQQEELWLLRRGRPDRPGLLPAEVDRLYDAFEHPRATRSRLPLLPPVEARSYGREVRARVLAELDNATDLHPFAMVVQHEEQHDETMLATLQLRQGPPVIEATATLPAGRPAARDAVLVPGGEFVLGVSTALAPTALDNEQPPHVVDVPGFWIGRFPVSNADWQEFCGAGGYTEARWWSRRGWQHRSEAGLVRPMSWHQDGTRTRFGRREEIPAEEPVQHITFFEAEAYAAWAGARLPTEVEWEKACAWDPAAGRRRRWPWGSADVTPALANVGGHALRPAPLGAYPAGASAYGVEQLIGDIWEWTSSDFRPWPGFQPMLYAQYSAPFFGGDYRVLRGGSWAVAPSTIRPSFRNWDHPYRRQIFSGLRLAWDA